jgi:hypothetical protein
VGGINDYAFDGCTNVKEVTFGDQITSIGSNAFSESSDNIDVYITDPDAWCKIDFADSGSDPRRETGTLHILDQTGSEITDLILSDATTDLPTDCFKSCKNLISVTIPDSVTTIGANAFELCDNLTIVTLGAGITTVGDTAFGNCKNLKTVNFNAVNCSSMGSINNPVFSGCSKLVSINISENVRSIPAYSFKKCTGLTELIIPNNVTHVGSDILARCPALEVITIPFVNFVRDNVVYPFGNMFGGSVIGEDIDNSGSYTGCSQGVVGPDYISSYGSWIPTSLKKVIVTGGELLQGAFANLTMVTDVVIGDGIPSIGNGVFKGCSSLTNITIPNSVTSIYENAFENCAALDTVTYSGTSEDWNKITIKSGNNSLTAAKRVYQTT